MITHYGNICNGSRCHRHIRSDNTMYNENVYAQQIKTIDNNI